MDGVVADFDKAVRKLCPELSNKDDINYESNWKKVDEVCLNNPRIFETLEPIKNSIFAIDILFNTFDDIFDIYFLSSPMWIIPQSFMDKRLWLEKHFGDKANHRLILTKRKDLNIGDYLIDDTTRNGVEDFKGEHIHFGTKGLEGWNEVFKYLVSKTK